MLLPPFTVLIVKKKSRPVTIRVTGWLAFIVMVLCISILAGAVLISGRFTGTQPDNSVIASAPTPTASETYILVDAPDSMSVRTRNEAMETPDITEFEVTRGENGNVVFSFSVANTPAEEELYLWIMVNPMSAETAGMAIYPRSPLFRGLPVDYRNGIRHVPQNGRRLRLTFSGPDAGITLERFRILAYETSGSLIIDKTLTVQETIRM